MVPEGKVWFHRYTFICQGGRPSNYSVPVVEAEAANARHSFSNPDKRLVPFLTTKVTMKRVREQVQTAKIGHQSPSAASRWS